MKKELYKKSLESNADFKSTCCENILSNLYSLLFIPTNLIIPKENFELSYKGCYSQVLKTTTSAPLPHLFVYIKWNFLVPVAPYNNNKRKLTLFLK